MAESISSKDWKCLVCSARFIPPHVPKVLNSSHVVCQVCLEQNVEEDGYAEIRCPHCWEAYQLTQDEISTLKTFVRKCKEHDDEEINMYCESCNVFICKSCFFHNHNTHRIEAGGMRAFKEEQRRKLTRVLDDLRGAKDKLTEHVQNLTQLERNLDLALKKQENMIVSTVNDTNDVIQETGETMATQLQQITRPEIDAISAQRSQVHEKVEHIKKIESFHTPGGESEVDCMKNSAMLLGHIESLFQQEVPQELDATIVSEVCFIPDPSLPDILKLGELKKSGSVSSHQDGESTNTSGLFQFKHKSTLYRNFSQATSIVSSHCGHIAVLDIQDRHIHVYKLVDGKYRHSYRFKLLEDTSQPTDMAMSPSGDYLVTRGRDVEVYSLSGKYKDRYVKCVSRPATKSFRLRSERVFQIDSIAIASDGRIILGSIENKSITVMDSSDTKTRMTTSVKPCYLATDNLIKVAISDNISNKLCVMDTKTKKSIFTVSIESPNGLCFDAELDTIFVAQTNLKETGSHFIIGQYSGTTGEFLNQVDSDINQPTCDVTFVDKYSMAIIKEKFIEIVQVIRSDKKMNSRALVSPAFAFTIFEGATSLN